MENVRPIDANALTRWFEINRANLNPMDFDREKETYSECITMVDSMKTLDVQPVRHGRWLGTEYDGYADGLPVYDVWECSQCWEEWHGENTPCYCPNCGARMDVKEEQKNADM